MKRSLFVFILFLNFTAQAQVLAPREQSVIIDELLADRINNLLPGLMEKAGIDMWILISREYNEDPVLKTFLPSTWLSARRRTIIVFYNDPLKKQYEKLAIARYNVGETIKASWDMQKFPNQWDALVDIINTRNPKKIAINTSVDFGHADGMVYTEHKEFMEKIGAANQKKVVSAEKLAVNWLETRTEREMMIYPQLVQITHDIIKEAFSEKLITPGITTTDDVVWWFRKKFRDMGLDTWFHPSVDIQRQDSANFDHLRSFANRPKDQVIMPGDLLHCDVGITYLRLNTDIQEHAYVLQPGEHELPASLKKAMANGNRLQDILTSKFRNGTTGNKMLAEALSQAKSEGLVPSIYTHPLGFHGHAAGTTIGMWDKQGGVPGDGDYPLMPNTVFSIELNAATEIPEWKKSVRIMLEEDGYWDGHQFRYINGRQKEIFLIPRVN
ncbi:MAG TPA: M24 family metallopeptidase [Chitinophagaceae bacterium]|nr:M24 family metallopeptidase [Chitinophagaceae bacterium]